MNGSQLTQRREALDIDHLIPSTLSPLHLLRALYREARYLPDLAARTYVHMQIRNRFYHNRNTPTSTFKDPKPSDPIKADRKADRVRKLLREGRKQLLFLKRANSGETSPLTKVLEMTYGRRGKRKHELLRDLAPQMYGAPANNDDLRKLSDALDAQSNRSKNSTDKNNSDNDGNNGKNNEAALAGLPLFSDKFVALVKSQRAQRQRRFEKPIPRGTSPEIPDTNSWGRKMPVARTKNLIKKWYAETLERLMPPLPEAEWINLGKLATGKIKWLGSPNRSKEMMLSPIFAATEQAKAGWSGPVEEKVREEQVKWWRHKLVHKLTRRYMRRMWARIFVQCPLMKFDAERGRWDVKWGKVSINFIRGYVVPQLVRRISSEHSLVKTRSGRRISSEQRLVKRMLERRISSKQRLVKKRLAKRIPSEHRWDAKLPDVEFLSPFEGVDEKGKVLKKENAARI